ncbi:MAG: alpha-ketoglutarate-dependent dioxygenase AlkB [Bdellovibrionaceae bacterium]|nr:alpha-ketoglutarate-dependent dioxygenase AlkB [Pseudobdellovibrionaceae bacterium]
MKFSPKSLKSIAPSKSRNFQNHNLIYMKDYVSPSEKQQIFDYLKTLHPIWENRFSASNPPPDGEPNRQLLRPVYWLGNWQFACLDYYHPPKGMYNRCVDAEKYPTVLEKIIKKVEGLIKENFDERDIPNGWHLNTCLINYYGYKTEVLPNGEAKKIDTARVGEHKDFELGPIASISFGEKALFQFVKSAGKSSTSEVILQQWLEDSSLQMFGGEKFKKQLFHRVQRVEDKGVVFKGLNTTFFETRRVNFTFRYVPRDHIARLTRFPEPLRKDFIPYVTELATKSSFWQTELQEMNELKS